MKTLLLTLAVALLAGCGDAHYVDLEPPTGRIQTVLASFDGTSIPEGVTACGNTVLESSDLKGPMSSVKFTGYSSQVVCAQKRDSYLIFWKF